MDKLMKPLVTATVCVAVLSLTGCATTASSDFEGTTEAVTNTDPQNGWVQVVDKNSDPILYVDIYKRCDGTKMIYLTPGNGSGAHGISTVTNDPECVG